ncbi:serine hydrolase domain-containing protein [Paenibacillus aceris]|uniref:CubicO group peptidase (Beta-lactamase class C family) n=1 Tax=Paenibacillus aceris TaxID=869555 RepID=A0ABS4I0N0_9BACL|nr:serine hydrolase domain-containing protein [Paenibacillus aceris]MBP1964467.1 CubicO group peptidase (beta-lactamase class C family) [Paenibacillus aceris]NHW35820.1 beta-lactamase family protein [Paenibacillus aceris]
MTLDIHLTKSSPEQQGMNGLKLQQAFQLVAREIEVGEIPGGVALVGRNNSIVGTYAFGHSIISEETKLKVSEDTIYDCASLTKVIATLPLILQLIDRGELRLRDPISRYFPEFSANGKGEVTVRHVLTHTSGFKAYKDLHSHGWTPDQIKAAVLGESLSDPCGDGYMYSDFNYIILGEIAALLFGMPLDEAARRFVFEPLGMRDTGYRPAAALKPRIAATEFMSGAYRWGEVHDENAWAMGGVSGHAGVFSTAEDVAKYAAMWLNNGKRADGFQVLSGASIAAATRSYTEGKANANRGLGWVLKGDVWDASGDLFSPLSYGHTGFTGTSIWMDPESSVFAVLLTNRVHFGREKSVVRLRDCFHNAVAASVER